MFIFDIECPPPPEIQNGEVKYDSTSDGSTARYNCNNGYTLNGVRRIKCIGVKWNKDPPTCIAISPGTITIMTNYRHSFGNNKKVCGSKHKITHAILDKAVNAIKFAVVHLLI